LLLHQHLPYFRCNEIITHVENNILLVPSQKHSPYQFLQEVCYTDSKLAQTAICSKNKNNKV
jgi:hypothetical protein